jgi:ABC-type multidrug transport system ATPase subunit
MMTKPRLLMIDELAFGLAPMTVERLMDIVRRVNAEGATVILVEQSVNRAMTLAEHAFFLERGEVRFEGSITDLLQRNDLLRPVFLADVGSALGNGAGGNGAGAAGTNTAGGAGANSAGTNSGTNGGGTDGLWLGGPGSLPSPDGDGEPT